MPIRAADFRRLSPCQTRRDVCVLVLTQTLWKTYLWPVLLACLYQTRFHTSSVTGSDTDDEPLADACIHITPVSPELAIAPRSRKSTKYLALQLHISSRIQQAPHRTCHRTCFPTWRSMRRQIQRPTQRLERQQRLPRPCNRKCRTTAHTAPNRPRRCVRAAAVSIIAPLSVSRRTGKSSCHRAHTLAIHNKMSDIYTGAFTQCYARR